MVDRLLHAASMRGFEQFESDIHMAGARPPGKELPQFKAAPRVDIFAIHLARRGRNPEGFDLDSFAHASEDFSGAEIEEAINSALYEAFHEQTALSNEHIQQVLQGSVPLSKTMQEKLTTLREWAEGRARLAS